MEHFNFNTISMVEIDVTSYCNSFCGRCARNHNGGQIIDGLPLVHLPMSAWESLIQPHNLINIEEIIFNGSFGDFSMHPKIIYMLEKLLEVKPSIFINAHTNGGARSPQFWAELSTTLQKFHKHVVTFGIDGLEDTHSIYRRGTYWKKIMKNVFAFIDAGGYAVWKCIVFDHNIDQLNEMEQIAKSMGFATYQTNRNTMIPMYLPAYKSFPEITITSPDKDQFIKKYRYVNQFKKMVYTNKTNAVKSTGTYDCPYAKQGLIMIDKEGNVWQFFYIHVNRFKRTSKFNYKNGVNITNNSLEEIMGSSIFTEVLPNAWKNNTIKECNNCAGIRNPIPLYYAPEKHEKLKRHPTELAE